ncbi:hypothetical protein QNA08_15705 [Chelatococcus sp. SYSU_G07232]|uniref:Uncharacterized protein n=1 Tax=Chelatococcus albus TaxID=3047466 RepID=A0ABT7ALH7_9HYPH|nr:hypothetical protein [Chelatococcus sp. SYSU_G07232]MDJ1159669.1 hypothetical protein [Chelatococcus sp. SYSU_G07232]
MDGTDGAELGENVVRGSMEALQIIPTLSFLAQVFRFVIPDEPAAGT